jgi:hypothetical protein
MAGQQQQQQQLLLSDLQCQVHKLLLAHVTYDATGWRSILHLVEDYTAFLNPPLVAGALHSLQASSPPPHAVRSVAHSINCAVAPPPLPAV